MKKLHLLLLSITLCVFSACHNDIWDAIDGLDSRVTKLEELCKEMNTNITSLQTIVDVLQSNDFITSIVEIKKDGKVVGYTITFGNHDPITIYHGQDGKDGQNGTNGKDGQDGADGKDGQNGADGKDGITPVIGVAQDTDGVYYWTLNGEWLLDDNGNKLPVSGKDGANGADGKDGQDGKDGADGQDGQDGITPLLKIEDGYWYVSYDNGTSWTLMGQATGADGQNGQDGANGTDGKDGQDGADGKDGVTPLLKIENGYWYISYDNGATWAQLGKATGEDGQNGTNGTDGKDGQDGANGSNGKDGITPLLKIEDGYWYVSYDNGATWTQFGKATGADGQDGQNGTDGIDGQDGKDGVTPQLKIEEGYWFISYDNGTTWPQLGKAIGEDGKDGADGEDGKDGVDGADGKDGQDGDSMFQSVTQDENYVYFTLADGTVIKIAKASEEEQPNSEFIFTITYDANGGIGTMQPDTFYYGETVFISSCKYTKEGSYFINWNTKSDGTGAKFWTGTKLSLSKNITLYAQWDDNQPIMGIENGYEWVDLGLSVKWAKYNVGANSIEDSGEYFAWAEIYSKDSYSWGNYQYGQYYPHNPANMCSKYTSNGGSADNKDVLDLCDDVAKVKMGGNWRMPTKSELSELCTKCTWKWTTLNGINGYSITASNGNSIFLPTAGFYSGSSLNNLGVYGYYWSNEISTSDNCVKAYCLSFNSNTKSSTGTLGRECGISIRPVCP